MPKLQTPTSSGLPASANTRQKVVYDFPRPALTVDVAVVTQEAVPRVLLIRRKKAPFAGQWALPGGFVEENERLSDAAVRELVEETGLTCELLEQLHTAGDPDRDPRGWTVSVVFLARVMGPMTPTAGDDAAAAKWFRLNKLPSMAFDHAMILQRASVRLQDRIL